jgi:cell division protein FtsW
MDTYLRGCLRGIDPFADAEDTGYQIIQSLYALAKGGPFGVGIGKGISKMGALPAADTDYVISIIGEEMGFLGVMMVVLLYALLVGRLFYYSVKVDEPFGKAFALWYSHELFPCLSVEFGYGIQPFAT